MSTATDLQPEQVLHDELINKIVSVLQPIAIYQTRELWVIVLQNNSTISPANALKLLAALHHLVCFRVYSIGDLLTEINTGSLLLNHLCRRTNLIYNNNLSSLPTPLQKRISDTAAHARTVFSFGKTRSEAFLKGALFYLGENEINLCVFMLHQSTEMVLRSVIHALIGQEIKTHLITELNQKLKTSLPSLQLLQNDPELLQRLDASYIGVRYNHLYEISPIDIALLATEVQNLLQTAESMVTLIVPG